MDVFGSHRLPTKINHNQTQRVGVSPLVRFDFGKKKQIKYYEIDNLSLKVDTCSKFKSKMAIEKFVNFVIKSFNYNIACKIFHFKK